MREVRLAERSQWKKRNEDDKIRRRLWYRWKDRSGKAQELDSDTIEERVLKTLKPKLRRKARYYIDQNLSDDGHFAHLRDNVKKRPRTGFEVGALEDLKMQAKYGGVKLPGTFTIEEGGRQVTTSVDLKCQAHVKEWDRIRIGKYVFDVSNQNSMLSFDGTNLPLVQVYRGESVEGGPAYLMPPRSALDRRRDTFLWTLKFGQIAQVGIRGKVTYYKNRAKLSNKIAKSLKKMGYRKSAAKSKQAANRFERKEEIYRYMTAEHARKAGSKQQSVRGKDDGEDGTIADQLAARKAEKATGQYLGAEEVLESQWEEKFDVERQKKYWVHKETGETTFEEPKKSSLEMTSAERELEEAKRRNEERKAAKEARSKKNRIGRR